jgi:hypothetical protein
MLAISRSAIADEVDGEHADQDGKAGEGHHPPGAQHELARFGEHRAPFRLRRLRAHAEEAERGSVEDGVGEGERRLHDERRHAVRQDSDEHQPERTGAGDPRRDDIVLAALGEHRAAHQADEIGLQGQRQRDDGVLQPRSEDRHHDQREKETRKGEDDVHQPHDQGVDPAAEEAGDEAEHDPDDEAERHHHRADGERVARAVDEAREHVAADRVGAEEEMGAPPFHPQGRRQERIAVLIVRGIGRDEIGEDREEDEEEEDGEADHRTAVLGIMCPELGEAAGAGNGYGRIADGKIGHPPTPRAVCAD